MMRNRPVVVASLVAVLGLAACEAGEDVERTDPASGSQPERVDGSTGEAGLDDGPPTLAPIDHSGVTGTVETDRGEEEVTVTVTVEGLQDGVSYSAHVHDGRCAAGGPVRIPLDDLEPGDEGRGTFRLATDAATLPADEPVFVQVHGRDGVAVACADLPQPGDSPLPLVESDDPDA